MVTDCGSAAISFARPRARWLRSAFQTASSIAAIRSRSARAVTSRRRTPSGRTGSAAASGATGPITTVSRSSGTNPAAQQPLRQVGRSSWPCSFHSTGSPRAPNNSTCRAISSSSAAPVKPAEVAVGEETAAMEAENGISGPSRSTVTPTGNGSGASARNWLS